MTLETVVMTVWSCVAVAGGTTYIISFWWMRYQVRRDLKVLAREAEHKRQREEMAQKHIDMFDDYDQPLDDAIRDYVPPPPPRKREPFTVRSFDGSLNIAYDEYGLPHSE